MSQLVSFLLTLSISILLICGVDVALENNLNNPWMGLEAQWKRNSYLEILLK